MTTKPSILIATPMYGGMCTGHYVLGLLDTINFMGKQSVPIQCRVLMNESLITRARNELTRLFLESTCSHLMFIDADISFAGDAVAMLLAGDKDVACGIYPKKEIDWEQIAKAALEGKAKELKYYGGAFVFNMIGKTDAEATNDGFLEVRHGGTGFMLIKRGVFEHLKPHVPTYRINTFQDPDTGSYAKPLTPEFFATSIDEGGALLSEDYHFCELFRKHGGKIHAQPFIKLEHVGAYVYGGDVLKSGGNLR